MDEYVFVKKARIKHDRNVYNARYVKVEKEKLSQIQF